MLMSKFPSIASFDIILQKVSVSGEPSPLSEVYAFPVTVESMSVEQDCVGPRGSPSDSHFVPRVLVLKLSFCYPCPSVILTFAPPGFVISAIAV